MKVINLFTKYFLMLLLIQGFIAVSLDSTSFKDSGMNSAATKAKIIGKWIMILGVTLYILRWVVAS
ncbi:CLC_0170 family protein [Clostridium massiliodielmoense]|uniref:CLC_0170 family protein n=1 Tax=Clostridium massiliodielmoense TaxID=1776385 RepID=UPI0004D88D45|nr:hypothetical protein Z962_02745 [Clostridium botulinum C/D str. BKT12695]